MGSLVRKGCWVITMVFEDQLTTWKPQGSRATVFWTEYKETAFLSSLSTYFLSYHLYPLGLAMYSKGRGKGIRVSTPCCCGTSSLSVRESCFESSFLSDGTVIRMNFIALGSSVPHRVRFIVSHLPVLARESGMDETQRFAVGSSSNTIPAPLLKDFTI